ncbi:MAG: S41 family peptidase [Chitinophagaceae bacterium]
MPGRSQLPVHPDSIYVFIKYNSVWNNTIADWKPVDESFHQQLAAARTEKDTMNCFVMVLEKLNDVHSVILYNNKQYGYFKPVDSLTYLKTKPLLQRAEKETGHFTTRMLPGKILYLRVPGINAFNPTLVNQQAQALYDSVFQFAPVKPSGIIVDLRLNTGGNMYPMLAGLSPVLGNNALGCETDMNGNIARLWEIKNGDFYTGGYQATTILRKYQPVFEKVPVAVLTGPLTTSSGSMTAIAFKQRPRTLFIGEPTAEGYTTGNGYFQFAPNLTILLSTNFAADRRKQVYKQAVPVDVTVKTPDNFDDLLKDGKIKAALNWLRKN